MPAEALKWTLKKYSIRNILCMYSRFKSRAACSLIQLEPGNTSTEITLPDSTMELYNLGYSTESITDALYKAALKTERCGYKKQQAKASTGSSICRSSG
jgi:hypothetical protein